MRRAVADAETLASNPAATRRAAIAPACMAASVEALAPEVVMRTVEDDADVLGELEPDVYLIRYVAAAASELPVTRAATCLIVVATPDAEVLADALAPANAVRAAVA